MDTEVIGSRYRLGGVVTCTPEATTWRARDTWLDERVLVVTPEPGCGARFAELAGALMDRASAHLVGLYDIGATLDDFVVFGVPAATFSDERVPREEEDVLVAGRALGDALDALHERGVVHGDLHPGSVAVAASGDAALSPWPLAPRPLNWSGPGGFGSDPDERRDVSTEDDLRGLGAVLLGALAGPPVLSSEQVENLERELAGRAPSAVAIADRALTPRALGGYEEAAELRDDCAAALSGQQVPIAVLGAGPAESWGGAPAGAVDSDREAGPPEGRRAALVVATAGAAVLAGLGISGAFGATTGLSVHPVTTNASGCVVRSAAPRCYGPDLSARPGGSAAAAAARPGSRAAARLADHPVSSGSGAAGAPASLASGPTSSPAPATTGTSAPAASTTTTAPPSTTTSSSPTTSSTTTSTSPTTTTTTAASTTTSSSVPGPVQAGPNGHVYGSGR